MARERSSGGFKNGQCMTGSCSKYKGEIFKIPVGADFVCPECGKKLIEVKTPPPPPPIPKLLLIIGGVLLVAGIVAGICLWPNGTDNSEPDPVNSAPMDPKPVTSDPVKPDPVDPNPVTSNPVKPDPDYKKSFPYYVSYGIYKGDVVEGYAEGKGELIFTKQHPINKLELKPRMAQKGWRIVGTFYHGLFIMGDVYNENDELIECPIIGKPANAATAYDEKLKNRY